jgi:hypothetical protein
VTLEIAWKVSNHILSYDQQRVSDISHFLNGNLNKSSPITNSLWVTLDILWNSVFSCVLLWPIASEWHCTFCERQSHHMFSFDQQRVSNIPHFVRENFPMTNRMWVTLHILWKAVSSHIFLYQQFVSDQVGHIVKGNLITCFPMTNSLWVKHFVKSSLITCLPMTNSEWVMLDILWQAVSSHLLLWQSGSEWHWTFCERQSCHMFSYDQQQVSEIAHFVHGSLITSFPMTDSKWATLLILWKTASSAVFLLGWTFLHVWRQENQLFSQGILLFFAG